MKKSTMLMRQGCPYCAKALQAIEELRAENPAYQNAEVECIDENEEPEKAKAYANDYYYLPSLFVEGSASGRRLRHDQGGCCQGLCGCGMTTQDSDEANGKRLLGNGMKNPFPRSLFGLQHIFSEKI